MKVSITDEAQPIPADLGHHRLIGRNTGSNTIYLGFTDAVVGDNTAAQGIPIEAGEIIAIDRLDALSRRPHFVCADGQTSTLNYDFQ